MSVSKQLQAVVELQKIDLEIDRLEELNEKIPNQIGEEERRVKELEEKLEELKQQRLELIKKRDKREVDVKEYEGKIEGKQAKRFSVSSQQEFDSINHEIKALEQKIEDASEEYLVLDEEIDRVQEEIREQTVLLQEAQGEAEKFKKEREKQLERNNSELEKLKENRKMARDKLEDLDDRLARQYSRIRKKRKRAVVAIEGLTCGGCRSKIPAQRINEVRELRKVYTCESCSRILYWDEDAEEKDE